VEQRQLTEIKAYVGRIIDSHFPARLGVDEREELVGDGLELYASGLRGKRLGVRLIDRWRSRNPGSRSQTPPPAATGLAWEHGESAYLPGLVDDEARRLESYRAALVFREEAELGDPRLMGKYIGMPSAAVVPPSRRESVWDSIERDREEFRSLLDADETV
jgi:hypothetical protein